MMSTIDLSQQHCSTRSDQMRLLSAECIAEFSSQLHDDWKISSDSSMLVRHFNFKGFAKATYLANLCAWLADREGHHPDVAFGWGYCHVTMTTHDVKGLTENDFIWAARLDALTG